MKLDEAMQFIKSLGYTIKGVERKQWFKKDYFIYTIGSGRKYLFLLKKGKLYKELPFKCDEFWSELEEIR